MSPAEFIPIAEESGLITRIGAWTMRTAAAQAAGKFDDEIVACQATMAVVDKETKEVSYKEVTADRDDCNRPDTTLEGLATTASEAVQVSYVNPETGADALKILGFSALMLRPGEAVRLGRRSASAVFHVVEGEGSAAEVMAAE